MTENNAPRRSRGRCYPYGGERSGNVYIKRGSRPVFAEQSVEDAKPPLPPTPQESGEQLTIPLPPLAAPSAPPPEQSEEDTAYEEYLRENPSKGFLKVQAYRAREAIPQSDVEVRVSAYIGEDEREFFRGRTNENGIIDNIELPAPPRSNSLESGDDHPTATYLLNATSEGFIPITVGITVFEGIKTIQPLPMIIRVGGNDDAADTNT